MFGPARRAHFVRIITFFCLKEIIPSLLPADVPSGARAHNFAEFAGGGKWQKRMGGSIMPLGGQLHGCKVGKMISFLALPTKPFEWDDGNSRTNKWI